LFSLVQRSSFHFVLQAQDIASKRGNFEEGTKEGEDSDEGDIQWVSLGTDNETELASDAWARQFVERHRDRLKTKSPVLLREERIRASLWENVEKWLVKIRKLIEEKKYPLELFYQFDETSCVVHSRQNSKRVCSGSTTIVPLLQTPPIFHLTFFFCIKASGDHLTPHLLLPQTYDLSALEGHDFPTVKMMKTAKGWQDRETFETIVEKSILPDIERTRTAIGRPDAPALIVADGHCSRANLALVKKLAAKKIDLVILPSHTSHILQPLDLGPNGEFKRRLRSAPPYPSKTRLRAELPTFIRALLTAAHYALAPDIVMKSFITSGLLSPDLEQVKKKCLLALPASLPPRAAPSRFGISAKVLTDAAEIAEWEKEEARKAASAAGRRVPAEPREAVDDVHNRVIRIRILNDDPDGAEDSYHSASSDVEESSGSSSAVPDAGRRERTVRTAAASSSEDEGRGFQLKKRKSSPAPARMTTEEARQAVVAFNDGLRAITDTLRPTRARRPPARYAENPYACAYFEESEDDG
jgi:hypothetical protein